MSLSTIYLIVSLGALLGAYEAYGCNEAVCASVVSKCQLTQSCKCNLKNCSCCSECFACLGFLYSECCSCVDMCPKTKIVDDSLSTKSHVEDFPDPLPELFTSIMAEPDIIGRWQTYTFPVDIDTNPVYSPSKFDQQIKLRTNNEQEVAPRKDNIISVNCTVAYMSQCTSWHKCKQSCQATGASKYRWFHDGCCQCIGHTCVGYGSEKSLCSECPLNKADDFPMDDKSSFYYDDEMEFTLGDKSMHH